MTPSLAGPVSRPRRPRAAISVAVGLIMLLALAPIVTAAPVAKAWSARIGTGGVNGAATINVLTTGTGSISLKLAKLRASTYHTVVVSKGTCSSAGTALVKFASLKTTSAGTAARTTRLTAAQVNLIKAATKGAGKMAIRVAYGRTVKCGVFAAAGVPPYVAAQITVGRSPSGVTVDPSGVWVTNWWDSTLSRIDPATNRVLSVVPVDLGTAGPEAIAGGAGSLWVTSTELDANGNDLPSVVKRLDSTGGATLATIPVGAGAYDIDVSPGAVWVANWTSGTAIRIDPATNQVVATLPVPYASGVAFGLGAVWVVGGDGKVTRIDPTTNQIVATIQTQTTGGFIATGNGAVWVTHPGDPDLSNGSLSRIDPAANQVVANTPLGSGPMEIVVAGTDVWVGMYGEPTVVRVSATTNAVLNRVAVSSEVYAIAVGPGVVWAVHNLPLPEGGAEPPAGAVSRISASAPIAAVKPAPTPTLPAGSTLVTSTHFTMVIPAGWTRQTSSAPNVISVSGPEARVLVVSVKPTSSTLAEVTAQIALGIKNSQGADPERDEAITIGGAPARLMTFHYTIGGIAPVYVLEAICVRNGRVYEISFGGLAGSETADRALFLNVLASFRFASAAG